MLPVAQTESETDKWYFLGQIIFFCDLSEAIGSPSLPILLQSQKKTTTWKNSVRFVKATVDGFGGFKLMEINVATMFSRDEF